MNKLAQAIKLAATVHVDQVDKGGEPYILHCLAVMNTVSLAAGTVHPINPHEREALLCAAVLHDVIEDFKGEPGEKNRLKDSIYTTFGARTYQAIDLLTKFPDEDYLASYIERVASDWIARRVKIADLTHNMDVTRMPDRPITQKDFERWEKYRRAIVRLKRED